MRFRIFFALAGAALCVAPSFAAAKLTVPVTLEGSIETQPQRFIVMQGEGSVSANPDVAVVSGGVVSHARHAGDALHDNADAMAKVVAALKGLGITDKEITTADFSFAPQYETDDKGNRDPSNRIVGYDVSNEILVTLTDLSKAGNALDALIENGANDSAGVRFEIKDRQTLETQARALAGADAMKRAQIYAAAVGAELGPVRSIHEGYPDRNDAEGTLETVVVTGVRGPATRVEAGAETVTATVTVVWALK